MGGAGGFVEAWSLGATTRRRMRSARTVVLGFGVVCLLTVLGMTLRPSGFQFEGTAPAEGGTLGPVEVPRGEMRKRAWWGNPIPVRYAAFVAFFLGGILVVAPRLGRSQQLLRHLKEGGGVRYDSQTWRVGSTFAARMTTG